MNVKWRFKVLSSWVIKIKANKKHKKKVSEGFAHSEGLPGLPVDQILWMGNKIQKDVETEPSEPNEDQLVFKIRVAQLNSI